MDLSLNTIVIAAIVLIVLVVMVLIFTGKIGGFVGGTKDCETLGGSCTSEKDCNKWAETPAVGGEGSLGSRIPGADDSCKKPGMNYYCCKLIYSPK